MKLTELWQLCEGSMTPILYHFTNIANLEGILERGLLTGNDNSVGDIVSLTRKKDLRHKDTSDTRIVINRDKLASRYKITPHRDKTAPPRKWSNSEDEEFVDRDIKDIKNYIIRVDILSNWREIEEWEYGDAAEPETTQKILDNLLSKYSFITFVDAW